MIHKFKRSAKLERLREEIEIKTQELCPFKPTTNKSLNYSHAHTEKKFFENEEYCSFISEKKGRLIKQLKEKYPVKDFSFKPDLDKK